MDTECPHIVEAMANPRVLIDGGHLYTDNPDINEAMHALYNFNEQGVITTIRPDHIIRSIFERFLQPFLLPTMNGGFRPEDIRGLIVNIVLYDALLDETFGPTRDIPEYHPDLLLELIGEARRAIVNNSNDSNDSDIFADELYNVRIDQTHGHGEASSHILLWASERLLPYFANELGMMFVQDARTIEGNTYLHCYLSSAVFRILNPDFVDELLMNGFRLNDQNYAGETPLHMIVYASDDPFAHLTNAEIRANPKSREVKRYKRFYQSMVRVFQDPDVKMDIKNRTERTVLDLLHQKEYPQYHWNNWSMWNNDQSNQVDHIPNEQNMGYLRKNALEAYDVAVLRPRAVEKARKKIVKKGFQNKMESQKKLGSTITNIIWNMAGTPEEYEQAAIERKQQNNITRRKMLMHQELLNRTRSKHSGGRTHKRRTHKKRTHKKRVHKKQKTRR
jgi:hypothetical protein